MGEWLTVKEAMAYLKVSRTTLYMLTARNKLRWYEVEGVRGRRFKRGDLDELVKTRGGGQER